MPPTFVKSIIKFEMDVVESCKIIGQSENLERNEMEWNGTEYFLWKIKKMEWNI